ncbi:hypothetical protein SACT1_1381 [Streptomyces sp. ACT-1]|nr:hypothetical protein SACT1_1381 [Streptomyces sp. ACT-1]
MEYMPPVGGAKQDLPELTDHCRPSGKQTFAEHDYAPEGTPRCRRCATTEK